MRDFGTNSIGAVGLVLQTRPYRYLALGLFALALTAYVFTLPAVYTGGVVGLISLRYLTAELLFFSLAPAALPSLGLTPHIAPFRPCAVEVARQHEARATTKRIAARRE